MRGASGRVELMDFRSAEVACQPQSLVGEGGVHLEPSIRSIDAIEAGHVRSIGGDATGQNAGREAHGPGDILLDRVEASVVVNGRGIGGDVLRLLAGKIAAGTERVDANIEDRAS